MATKLGTWWQVDAAHVQLYSNHTCLPSAIYEVNVKVAVINSSHFTRDESKLFVISDTQAMVTNIQAVVFIEYSKYVYTFLCNRTSISKLYLIYPCTCSWLYCTYKNMGSETAVISKNYYTGHIPYHIPEHAMELIPPGTFRYL